MRRRGEQKRKKKKMGGIVVEERRGEEREGKCEVFMRFGGGRRSCRGRERRARTAQR
jgi:hypothetical protein